MREALMAIGWFTGGIVICVFILRCNIRRDATAETTRNGFCPQLNIKCWIAGVISAAYGFGYYYLMGMKSRFTSLDYLVSFVVASVVGAAVARIICPW